MPTPASITPVIATGSTNGKQIAVGTTSTAIHTATATAGEVDSVTLRACNTSGAARILTLEWGGATAADVSTIPIPNAQGWFNIVVARRAAGGIAITAKGDAAGVYIDPTVDRYKPAVA